jgi:hypothetical protein
MHTGVTAVDTHTVSLQPGTNNTTTKRRQLCQEEMEQDHKVKEQ